ncbi:armadillo-type fold protein [Artemisia annua]|uniref:Armadillo-type fold protein n=1 Tax=Artemisia annua TaxID=35608 RepID=A0A2U1P8W8_ARTAN|nr:armadillo-type fold protein [Artemisia annua]
MEYPKNTHFLPYYPQTTSSFDSDDTFGYPFGQREDIDVDQSLSEVFSMLSVSPASFPAGFPVGHVGSSGDSDDGFGYPFGGIGNMESFRGYGCREFGFDFESNFESRSNFDFRNLSGGFGYDNTRLLLSNVSENADKQLLFQRLCDFKKMNGCFDSRNFFKVGLTKGQSQHNVMRPWCLRQFRGMIYNLAKDQNGCRLLQSLFARPTLEDIEMVLFEVVDKIADLMKDQFGNYLVQKLVAVCNIQQKMELVLSLTRVPTNIILVCMSPHGTRAVQRLLENLSDPTQVMLVMNALRCGAVALATDPNGHHVIQYCLVNYHCDLNKPILNEIADECYKVATDRSGCCVLQACVERSRGAVRTRIITEIVTNSVHLAQDPFGNYVLQHMVGLKQPALTALLVRQLQGNFVSLSCNKYASNVVEKCLNEAGEEVSRRIILELVKSPDSSLLLVNPFANFVIQSALKVSKGFAQDSLRNLISKNTMIMRSNLYGKKILDKFEKKKVKNA